MQRVRQAFLAAVFLAALGVAAAAQEGRKIRIGFLSWWSPELSRHVDYLKAGLAELGYVDGKNLDLKFVFTDGNRELTRQTAERFVQERVDILVVSTTPAIHIAKEATQTIPIVMAPVADPIATGLVKSWSHPGGNITGVSMIGPDLAGKRLEFLREIKPQLATIGFLGSSKDANTKTFVAGTQAAADRFGLKLVVRMVGAPEEIDEGVFEAMKRDGVEAVVVQPIFMGNQGRIVPLAMKAGVAVVSDYPLFAEAGALLTYGIDDAAQMRRAAYFVDRILKGASPAELPIERPTKLELAINVKTAKALGLQIPPSLLVQAEHVIE